ncbi:MAG: phosphomethylpyrimidine synthase ThiC [Candidatus Omnitrophica bacterium]|jgi:phosphomethylpyrimidine synthase|nr:phosphomethylpyrimidine synthase ThiC [Candidatus Omnitrophota bacterium]
MFKKSFLKKIAQKESVSLNFLERQLQQGKVVIPVNSKRHIIPPAIGQGFKVKVNANIGTSTEKSNVNEEIKKLKVALDCKADTIMDLSTGGNLAQIRRQILNSCPAPLGTVPIYEAAVNAEKKYRGFEAMTFDDIWDVLKSQAEDGVDFFTIHVGIIREFLKTIAKKKRVGGIVSRGGAILTRWMYVNKRENPFYENFDKIMDLAKEYNITLSLGDALRPGAIADSSDDLQISELMVLGELVKKCHKRGVQVMVEGPGHIRMDEIAFNMLLQKKVCQGAPFYVLGPLPTDIAAGYDHVSAAIGGAIAAFFGADFLCVVTPAEHLRQPYADDIRDGVISSKIAAHCVDVLRFKDELEKDRKLSTYRAHRNWKKIFPLTLDEEKSRKYRKASLPHSKDMCTMCGSFCSLKIIEKCNLLR